MCGTTRPTKLISPATAIAAPESSDDTAIRKKRNASVRRPSALAVSSPSISTFILDGSRKHSAMPAYRVRQYHLKTATSPNRSGHPPESPDALPSESAKNVLIISLNAPNSADTAMPDSIILTGLTPR